MGEVGMRVHWLAWLWLVGLAACSNKMELDTEKKWYLAGLDTGSDSDPDEGGDDDDSPDDDPPDDDPPDDDIGEALEGYIGSPCDADGDCEYDGGVCLLEGFPEGMCSLACDGLCPDEDGFPVTFCVDTADLPEGADEIGPGACVSRCSFDAYAYNGCRDDYGCAVEARYSEPSTEIFTCIPGREDDLSSCHYELADRGVSFEPTVRQPDYAAGQVCEIEDPVYLLSPMNGIELQYYDGTPTPRTLAACEMGHALMDSLEDVADYDVDTLLHIGTYNCRVIAGTSVLSRHSYADAIDIYGFGFTDGRVWTMVDDWEHGTSSFSTEAAAFLYNAAQRWYEDHVWNIILTPNYNSAHDNHFHVDLTPSAHTLGFTDDRYFGPALYVD